MINKSALTLSISLLVAVAIVTFPPSTFARPPLPPPVGTEAEALFISDVAQIAPGRSFFIGAWVSMQPKWHIYWKNPGSAGLPTALDVQAPEGFVVEPFRWPAPIRFVQPGDIAGFGYEEEVFFLAKVTPPVEAMGQAAVFRWSVEWLACKDVCIPGSSVGVLRIPWAQGAEPVPSADAPVFASWQFRLPDAGVGKRVGESLMVERSRGEDDWWVVEAAWPWDGAPEAWQWCPLPGPQLEVEELLTETRDGSARLRFRYRQYGSDDAPRLYSVVTVFSGESPSGGFPLDLDLQKR